MTKQLDLLLVNPGNQVQAYGELSDSLSGIEPPFWCGLIAAFARKHGYSVKIIDADAENLNPEDTARKITECNPLLVDIVVLGTNPSASSTPKMAAAKETLIALKNKATHIKTVLSGLHPSALPEQTMQEESTDFVCQGDGFYTILALLETLKSGRVNGLYKIKGLWFRENEKIISNPPAPPLKSLDELPFVAWDLLPMDRYRAHNWHCLGNLDERGNYAVIYTSLGCPFKCSYCPIHAFYGKPNVLFGSPERVIEEIDLLVKNYNIKNIKIMDELFVMKKDRVILLCDLIIERGYKLNMWAYARVDTVDEPLLKKMKQAGINWVCYGFESANESVRLGVGKRTHQEKTRKAIEMTRAAGIYILANFMFGLPDDNLETMQQTLNMAKEFNFEYVNFYVTMAYPGSKLYEETIKKGIRLPSQWRGYAQLGYETMPLPTKYLSSEEVLRFRDEAFNKYYSNYKYLEMVAEKFGPRAVKHIKDMLKHKVKRKLLG
ncbi:MAG: radical SAM protein [Candidatus Omnitrophota bacterium]